MDLKNAVAVCLISLFSATLVVMIARTLDQQAAARLEPQLAAIAAELQAIRTQGGIAASPSGLAEGDAARDALTVYYFHSNTRCPTCETIESLAREAVQTHFAPQLARGEVVWKILNYEQPAAAGLARQFDVQMPVVVLAQRQDGDVRKWKSLDEVWGLWDDKPAFLKFVRDEIQKMLVTEPEASSQRPKEAKEPEPSAPAPADLPIPSPSSDIPVPQ